MIRPEQTNGLAICRNCPMINIPIRNVFYLLSYAWDLRKRHFLAALSIAFKGVKLDSR